MKKSDRRQAKSDLFGTVPQAPDFTSQNKFAGTGNRRHLRAIAALMTRPLTREQLDSVAGCSNGPDLVASLRRKGLTVPCVKVPVRDRDGFVVEAGVYSFTAQDRRALRAWQRRRDQRGV